MINWLGTISTTMCIKNDWGETKSWLVTGQKFCQKLQPLLLISYKSQSKLIQYSQVTASQMLGFAVFSVFISHLVSRYHRYFNFFGFRTFRHTKQDISQTCDELFSHSFPAFRDEVIHGWIETIISRLIS